MKLVRDFPIRPDENSIILICIIRDERLLLPAFLKHYQKMGVSHFVFIDNGSVDTSVEYLLGLKSLPMQIWHTSDSYAENNYGIDWVNRLLAAQFRLRWCVVVDIDEFIVLDGESLVDLRSRMISLRNNVSQFVLIDFYPYSLPFSKKQSAEDFNPFEHSHYYDSFEDSGNYFKEISEDGSFVLKGGVRRRVYGNENSIDQSFCLNKKSFFFYDFFETHRLSEGMHWLWPLDFIDWTYNNWDAHSRFISYSGEINLIAHFKFAKPDLYAFFEKRVERNQDWGNSQEYRNYIENWQDSFFDERVSRKLTTIRKLYSDTICQVTN
jgi:hypothetical protein